MIVLLDKFKYYISGNYSDYNLTLGIICSDIDCSKTNLHELLSRKYGYSSMRYVEYFRILKAIELISKGSKKVYLRSGYRTSSVFSKAFLRVTGFNARYFYSHKDIIQTRIGTAEENPKRAIEVIIKHLNKIDTFIEQKNRKISQKGKTT